MISTQDIYNATDGGLRIIKYFYPEADVKGFSIRENDDTPSAKIKKIKDIWRLTDFGEDTVSKTPIDIIMDEKLMKVGEAIYWAAKEFGIATDVITKEKNVAKIERREAIEGETEGLFQFKQREFTKYELQVLGPKVNEAHCEALNWMSLEYLPAHQNG